MKIKKLVESKLIEAEDTIDAAGSVKEIADDDVFLLFLQGKYVIIIF